MDISSVFLLNLLNFRSLFSVDAVNIGLSFNFWSFVTLTEGEPVRWYRRPPVECIDE